MARDLLHRAQGPLAVIVASEGIGLEVTLNLHKLKSGKRASMYARVSCYIGAELKHYAHCACARNPSQSWPSSMSMRAPSMYTKAKCRTCPPRAHSRAPVFCFPPTIVRSSRGATEDSCLCVWPLQHLAHPTLSSCFLFSVSYIDLGYDLVACTLTSKVPCARQLEDAIAKQYGASHSNFTSRKPL